MKQTYSLLDKLLTNYDSKLDKDGIVGERIARRLDEISKIGLTVENGSNRPGFSREELRVKQLVSKWMHEAGMQVTQDGAGNVYGRIKGKNDHLPAIMSGSHVDSVPNGGHFDGPLGVLLALEVAEAWKEQAFQPEKPYEVVIFSDEEGSRFNNGLNGSEAVIGKANVEEKMNLKDSNDLSFEEVLDDVGLTLDGYQHAKRDNAEIELFVETHIEQGKQLEKEDLPCGIVTGIAGPSWYKFMFKGNAGHAGNTPMNDRKDALVAASEFIVKVRDIPGEVSESAVATTGKIQVEPNGVNVIPGTVSVYVDMRDIFKDTQAALIHRIVTASHSVAEAHGLTVTEEEMTRVAPVPIREEIQQKLEKSFQKNEVRPYYLASGAGHDAMIIGEKWPVAMLFVRSKEGISHDPAEWTDLSDIVKTARVLKHFIESSV